MAQTLNARQAKFVDAYLAHGNATRAATEAGYSAKTAEQIGSRLLRNVQVAGAIADRQTAAAERADVTVDRVVAELAAIAFADLRDVVEWDGDELTLIASDQLTDTQAAAVREVVARVETTDGDDFSRTTKHLQVKQHDKLRAIEMLMRHLGMGKETVKVEGLGEVFEAIRRRARERTA